MQTTAQTATRATKVPDIASRRILRLALGTAMSMAFAQLVNWPLSFIAAVLTMSLLALPLPAPTLKSGLKLIVALLLPAYASVLLIPFLDYARWAGVLLVTMALFGSFYYSARGGSPILGMFMTIGLTLVVTIGSVSGDILLLMLKSISVSAVVGVVFVAIAHALLPDYPPPENAGPRKKPPPPARPPLESARRNAFRSLMVVLPLVIIFLFASSSYAYVAVMIKVSSMGQQASAEISRKMGRQQLESTLWGGLGATLGFYIMGIWPNLLLFCLVIALACLVYGKRVFQGSALHPKGQMWSYALLTTIILLTPAVISMRGGDDAGIDFYSRLFLFIIIAVYGTLSVAVFNAFWPAGKKRQSAPGT